MISPISAQGLRSDPGWSQSLPKAALLSIRLASAFLVIFLLLWPGSANGVMFYSTGDPSYNTTAPEGSLANSGWQFQGEWGRFLGTVIAPKYFVTASHIGGVVGDKFKLGGVEYTTTATFVDVDSDLRIWRIAESFPFFASLCTDGDEVGRALVVFGRGTQRGGRVEVEGTTGNQTKGWFWGASDGAQRWGENRVESVVDGDAFPATPDGDTNRVGELLMAGFDAEGGPNEAHLSSGDSGGAVFLQDGPTWRLAGINYSVDGPYNTTDTGKGFQAVLFDEGSLYKGGEGEWELTPELPSPQPGAFYATRIFSHLEWINSVLASPIAEEDPALQVTADISAPFIDCNTATLDPEQRTITVPRPAASQFYRLRSSKQRRLTSIRVDGANLILTYE